MVHMYSIVITSDTTITGGRAGKVQLLESVMFVTKGTKNKLRLILITKYFAKTIGIKKMISVKNFQE